MTKSLKRLQRLAERKKIKGTVVFDPYTDEASRRYFIQHKENFVTHLGKNAQAARFALNHIGELAK